MSDDIVNRLRTATVADSSAFLYKIMTRAADEIEKLRSLVSELLPYMLNDMTQALQIGQHPFEQDHCKDKDPPCSDCQWFEDATLWKNRVDAGEFKEFI